jgi:protoheme IX farnesyltransferase
MSQATLAGDQPAARPGSPGGSVWVAVRAYVALTKPRIIELLLVTTLPTMMLAAHGAPPWWPALATLLGGTAAAGSANALNCYVDRDIDELMGRTRQRPLVRHTVTPRGALTFGVVLGAVAVVFMAATTNLLAAGLTLAAILFYIFVYTLGLKRRTSQNIVWGGAAGCMPVLIGWSVVTGRLDWAPLALFGVIFFWTPVHYWPLAMRFKADYARAGVPMLPVVAPPVAVVRQILVYGWATVATSLLLWPLATGWIYGVSAAVLGCAFLAQAHRLYLAVKRGTKPQPMKLFHLSNSYLALLFLAVAVDAVLIGR